MSSVGSSTRISGSGSGLSRVGDGVADVDDSRPTTAQMSPARTSSDLLAAQAVEHEQFGDCSFVVRAVALEQRDAFARSKLAANDAADADPADVVAVVERGDQHLQRGVGVDLRRRHVLQDRLEQRLHVVGLDRRLRAWPSPCVAEA